MQRPQQLQPLRFCQERWGLVGTTFTRSCRTPGTRCAASCHAADVGRAGGHGQPGLRPQPCRSGICRVILLQLGQQQQQAIAAPRQLTVSWHWLLGEEDGLFRVAEGSQGSRMITGLPACLLCSCCCSRKEGRKRDVPIPPKGIHLYWCVQNPACSSKQGNAGTHTLPTTMAMTALASTLLLARRTAPAAVQQFQAGALLPLMCAGLHTTHQCVSTEGQQPSLSGEYDRRSNRGKVRERERERIGEGPGNCPRTCDPLCC